MKNAVLISPVTLAAITLLLCIGCQKEEPECLTRQVTDISPNGVTLNGRVNTNGLSTIVTFEYGTSASYDNSVVAIQSPVNGDVITPVSGYISGLTPGVIYHYRIRAENSHWTVYGSDTEFEYGPPSFTSLEAINITSVSATLNGSVNPKGLTTYVKYEYGTSTDYGQEAIPEQTFIKGNGISAISANISGLACNTIYHFRLKAENSFGTTYSSDITFLTPAGPPETITLEATGISCTGATLKGSVPASCISFVATFQYGTEMTSYDNEVAPDQTVLTGDGSTEFSKNISGLTPGITYHFRLKTESSKGISYGSDLTFKLSLPFLTTSPVTDITATSAVTGGNIPDGCLDITDRGIELYRIIPRQYVQFFGRTHDGTGAGSFTTTLKGLAPSSRYYVRAYATNGSGTAYGNSFYFTTPGAGK